MAGRKEPVYLREKPLSSGRTSLYLEINKDGMRRYEFLKLYLTNGKSKADKQEDRKTWELAETIRAKRVVELRNSRFGLVDMDNGKADIIQFIKTIAQKRNGRRPYEFLRVARLLSTYSKKDRIEFERVDKSFLEGFITFLKTKYVTTQRGRQIISEQKHLSANSIYEICVILSTCFNEAVRVGIIQRNPMRLIDASIKPKQQETSRGFLTKEELKRLSETEIDPYTKRIFLFSCYTGLRHSDVITLKWEDIAETDFGMIIRKRQKKTGGMLEVPLNGAAVSLLPPKGNGLVFGKGKSHGVVNVDLKKWAKRAGLEKNLTFHVARHTFATMLISQGADIYVVSKLLGHTKISTTQIYAKVVDESRRNAVSLLPDFISDTESKEP